MKKQAKQMNSFGVSNVCDTISQKEKEKGNDNANISNISTDSTATQDTPTGAYSLSGDSTCHLLGKEEGRRT